MSPITAVFGTRVLADFRPWTEALVDWTTLSVDKVNELGEYKSSYVSESGESYRLFTIGGITGVSRQAWVNGAGALTDLSGMHGRRMAADVSDRAVAFIEQAAGAGPTMKDGTTVFAVARSNIATLHTDDLTVMIDELLAARAAASRRRGAGNVQIGVTPSLWAIAPEFEGTAIKALASVGATMVSDVESARGQAHDHRGAAAFESCRELSDRAAGDDGGRGAGRPGRRGRAERRIALGLRDRCG